MLSVIVPIFNSADTLPALCKAVMDELSGIDYEIILVNDGSTDQSEQVATVLAQTHLPVRLISLRKNFGEHNAVMCGLNKCVGDYAVIIDDDLQNPPSEIRKLLITTQTGGYDVVYARYDQKKHSFWRNKLGKMNNYLAGRMFKKPKGLYLNSFKIISRGVIDEIIKYTGPFPYIDGLIFRCTHNIGAATVVHEARHKGHSGYTFRKLFMLFFNMFFNFSILPLRIFTILGFLVFLTAFVLSVIFVVQKIMDPSIEAGWTSLIIAILALSGVQIIFMGLIGEYLGKQYLDQNKTPQWVIRKQVE